MYKRSEQKKAEKTKAKKGSKENQFEHLSR